jgi:thiol-disulfide isomerase/thioredoxin
MSGCGAGLRAALALGLAVAVATGLAPRASGASEAEIGLRAPACELTPLLPADRVPADRAAEAARPVEPVAFVRAFEGRVTLVDFWASWCPTCEHAFGHLNALARDYHEAGLDVVAVNLAANASDALDFLADRFADRRIEFELARDATGRCPRGFGLVGMPQAFLIDASGRIQAVTRGFRAGDARLRRCRRWRRGRRRPGPDRADPSRRRRRRMPIGATTRGAGAPPAPRGEPDRRPSRPRSGDEAAMRRRWIEVLSSY